MDKDEFTNKYLNLKILKGVQEYLKEEESASTAVYPIKVPDELLYQTLKQKGPQGADNVIHYIFKLGLGIWSENLYNTTFGSQQSLEDFISLLKKETVRVNSLLLF